MDSVTLGAFEMHHFGTKDARVQSDQGRISEPICMPATRKAIKAGEGNDRDAASSSSTWGCGDVGDQRASGYQP